MILSTEHGICPLWTFPARQTLEEAARLGFRCKFAIPGHGTNRSAMSHLYKSLCHLPLIGSSPPSPSQSQHSNNHYNSPLSTINTTQSDSSLGFIGTL